MNKTKSSKTGSSTYSNSLALNSHPQLAHRPYGFDIQKASVTAKTQTDLENEAFAEQQMEATGLSIQAKYGTITPEGQERLTVLQAKMDGLLNSRLEHATRFGHNIANIPLRRPDSAPPIQAKLTIGQPGDKYEQEADETARQVVQRIHQQSNQPVQREAVTEEEELQTKPVDNIQRQSSEEEELQTKLVDNIQRQSSEEDELQMQPMVQRVADGSMAASADVKTGIQRARGGGQPLADNIREPMEQAFGADFSGVRVHTDSLSDQLNQSIQAKAFTTGQDVFFRQGAYEPGSRGGQELLAHELTHVVQQGGMKQSPLTSQELQKHSATRNLSVSNEYQKITTDNNSLLHLQRQDEKKLAIQMKNNIINNLNLGELAKVNGQKNMVTATQSTVIQRYFSIDGQKTNDPGMFEEGTSEKEKRDFIWQQFILPKLNENDINKELIKEFENKLLDMAMNDRKLNFENIISKLKELETLRAEMSVPLSERKSPEKLPPLSSGTPELGDKEKHSDAKYKRVVDGENTDETFASDDYTKGPAKRRRYKENPTTPKGEEEQDWTTKGVKESIQSWSCQVPLSRYLAGYLWPLLKNTKEGKKWELKFREIDRLIDFRDNESQSSVITIIKRTNKEKIKDLARKDYTFKARQKLKEALLRGDKHPGDQQDVLFYDILLKADVKNELQDNESKTFNLNAAYEATGAGLSMILTHWRPIIFFDWILAEDVLNNAKD
ncbi:DUF4157 domain-containing protein [Nostoc punctiforme UO1]|uniref:eCIS core domain-containing protein n=1 Tax=Nostoc punctiforme TaxID=272131 RepID=UPI003099DA2C